MLHLERQRAASPQPGADVAAVPGNASSGPRVDRRGGAAHRRRRPDEDVEHLAKLTDAVHGVPLVLLIDQLEDMANQSAPVERFLKVVDAITAFTDTIPNTVVVLACLEDYFKANVEKLIKAKQDRLVRDPEPIRLLGNRTLDEIREMTARRLAHLYDMADVEVDPANELYPFRDVHLERLNNFRTRDALDFLRRHHQRCITSGPMGGAGGDRSHISDTRFGKRPRRTLERFPLRIPGDRARRRGRPGCRAGRRHPRRDGRAARWLSLRLCTAGWEIPGSRDPQAGQQHRQAARRRSVTPARSGGAFGKQLVELEKRAGDIPVAIVSARPTSRRTGQGGAQIAGMLKRRRAHGWSSPTPTGGGCWPSRPFRKQQATRSDFAAWQKAARPLGELDSLQKILRLSDIAAITRPAAVTPPSAAPAKPPRIESADSGRSGLSTIATSAAHSFSAARSA